MYLLLRSLKAIISTDNMNNKADKGHLCRIPLEFLRNMLFQCHDYIIIMITMMNSSFSSNNRHVSKMTVSLLAFHNRWSHSRLFFCFVVLSLCRLWFCSVVLFYLCTVFYIQIGLLLVNLLGLWYSTFVFLVLNLCYSCSKHDQICRKHDPICRKHDQICRKHDPMSKHEYNYQYTMVIL
jgi:hypothetical protein